MSKQPDKSEIEFDLDLEATKSTQGVSADVGTMNFVSARKVNKKIQTTRVRNAFIELPAEHKRMLKLSKTSYVELDGKLLVIGDEAIDTANLFNREARRPMSGGMVSAGELDAQQIMAIMMKRILGEPKQAHEKCCYSVPAPSVDVSGSDTTYHSKIIGKIIQELGYAPEPVNEALAIIFSECSDSDFSGFGISYGSGMTNICMAYNAMSALEFSLNRCLSSDFPVFTSTGMKLISDILPGDMVLDAEGRFVEVLSKINNGHRGKLLEIKLDKLPAFSYRMTSDHRIFVKTRYGWEWKLASDLCVGDKVGSPVIPFSGKPNWYFGCNHSISLKVTKSRNLGRFFGAFLGDGKACLPKKGGYIEISLDSSDTDLIEKYSEVCSLFGNVRTYRDSTKPGVALVHVESKVLAQYMRDHFYTPDGVKCLNVPLHEINDQMAIGLIEGLIDTDGHEERKRFGITNTSVHVISAIHHMLNRLGVGHSIIIREPRVGGVNHRGVQIIGRKQCYEIRTSSLLDKNRLQFLIDSAGNRFLTNCSEFAEFIIKSISDVEYDSDVWDLQVKSDHHSFSSIGMIVHNCGDWIDQNAAKAIGSTASKVCSIKESNIDISKPKNREEEAISVYIQALIDYSIENIIKHFSKVKSEITIPKPIPIIISGGTSKAGGFLDKFKERFEVHKSKFPVQVSEIKHAHDPLTAVATGLLLLATSD